MAAAAALRGQEPVAPETAEAVAAALQPHPSEAALACAVQPLAPVLTFRLNYRAGYSLTVPMAQLTEAPRTLEVLARITPKGGPARPVLLKQAETLAAPTAEQERDASKFEAQLRGAFAVGEGQYHVELAVTGGRQRVCRRQWDLEVKAQKGSSTALPPGTAAALSRVDLPRPGGRDIGLTIFLHAGAARGNPVLLESVAAIVERLAIRRVQVVAFSLDQRKELLREKLAGAEDFRRLAAALDSYNAGTVSYGVLRDPAGHRDFLWKLLAKEGLRAPPDDLAVFVGYSTFDDSHVFVPPAGGERRPVYVYLQYALPGRASSRLPGAGPRRMRGPRNAGLARQDSWDDLPEVRAMQPVMPDAISRATQACSGKVFRIYAPADLASALEKIDKTVR